MQYFLIKIKKIIYKKRVIFDILFLLVIDMNQVVRMRKIRKFSTGFKKKR